PEEAGAFTLSGGAAYSNNLTIDGLDNNDDRAARERFQPTLEAVEEVQVIRNQFSAEYGRASGGRVNLRTRGGANRFRGRAFYFFRDESLNANTFRNNTLGLKRLPLQQHNPGFTLSGPVVLPSKFSRPLGYDGRHRTFFFTAYEYDTVLDSTLIDTLVPILSNPLFPLPSPTSLVNRRTEPSATQPNRPAELAPYIEPISTPLRNHIFTARVDHRFSDRHNGTLLYQFGRLSNLRQFGGGSRLAEALQGRTRNSDGIAFSDNYVLSQAAVNQLRVQWASLTPAVETRGADSRRPVALIEINDPLAGSDPADRSGTLIAGSSTTGASDRRESRWQIQDALTISRGAHTLKLGGDVQRIRSTFIDLADASGTYNFTSAGDFLANAPSRFRQAFQNESTARNTYAGLFAQDQWQILSNLTLTYGARYENESIIRDRNNWAPRLGIAYDPFRSGRTVIRGGAGIFYNRALLRTIDDFKLGRQRLSLDTNNLRDDSTGRLLTPAERRAFIASNLSFPQALAPDSPLVRQYGTLNTEFSRRLDPGLRIPESYQASVGFEREIGSAFVLEANYTFNRGIHLWREFNQNAPLVPGGYKDLTEYFLTRDFVNFRNASGVRPLYNASSAGELVRFTFAPAASTNPDAIRRIIEFGVPVSIINLNSVSSGVALDTALAAINDLRPDPTRGEIEQLISVGNSFYHGLTIEARRRFRRREDGFSFSLRAAYTLSRLIDDGVVNTSDAVQPGDFHNERARSLLDRRHRFVFSGVFDAPPFLGRLRFSPIMRIASGAPFNITTGGVDRNLDDVSNDRPFFGGDVQSLRARRRGEPLDPALLDAFRLPMIGQTGRLPRNAGQGPRSFLLDLNVTREFRVRARVRLRPTVEIDNLLNKTVFTFGAEFINFNAFGATSEPASRQAFLESFLVPTRTLRPRSIRLGLRFDF
nr:TonB-dependent receptor [Pyrinomonadaceae bacterium]